MKISVVTACYNARLTIEDAILSVASQTHPDKEHVIVDGCSTDGTVEIIQSHQATITRWLSQPDDGIYDAMNKGIALAGGEVIGFLNADDMYADNSVLSRVARVFSDPAVDACYADLVYINQRDATKIVRYWKSCDYQEGLFERGWAPPHPTFFVRGTVFDRYGAFCLDYRIAADVELMIRFLSRYKIRSVYVPKVFVKMRVGGVTNRSFLNIVKQNLEIYRAGKKNNIQISPVSFVIGKIFFRIPQFLSRPSE